jgi:hypothetical protein
VVQITLHGWLAVWVEGCGGGLSVGEENTGVDVVEGAEAEGEGDAGDVGGDGDEAADDAELLASSSEDDNPSTGKI